MNYKDKKAFERQLEHIKILLSYKISPCKRDGCVLRDTQNISATTRCEFYHSEEDHRRYPFENDKSFFDRHEKLVRKIESIPSYGVADFFLECAKSNSSGSQGRLKLAYTGIFHGIFDNNNGCQNIEEYNYHPLNYKSLPCPSGVGCNLKYCAKFHTADEEEEFKRLKLCFDNPDSILKNLMQINYSFKNTLQLLLSPNRNELGESPVDGGDTKGMTPASQQDLGKAPSAQQTGWVLQKTYGSSIGQNQLFNQTDQVSPSNFRHTSSSRKMQVVSGGPSPVKARMNMDDNKSADLVEIIDLQKDSSVDIDRTKNGKRVSSQNIKPQRPASISSAQRESRINKFNSSSKKQVIKIGGNLCKPNAFKTAKFIVNSEVDIYENIHVEFKHFTILNLKTVTSYICAYLNSYGGTMFFGINDSGFVKGITLSRKDIDEFQVNLDIALRNFQPRVMPDQIKLEFHEIAIDDKHKHVLLDRYVVQIDVFCNSYNTFYSTDDNQFLIKRNGSINHLIPIEIVQYVRERHNPMINSDMFAQRINPMIFERMNKNELERSIRNLEETLALAKQHHKKM
jgi:hypothetical protein